MFYPFKLTADKWVDEGGQQSRALKTSSKVRLLPLFLSLSFSLPYFKEVIGQQILESEDTLEIHSLERENQVNTIYEF